MIDLKRALANGDVLSGIFSISGSPGVVESIAYAGFDFVIIDTEHAPVSPYGMDLQNLIRAAYAAGITPMVRTACNDPAQILKAMDMGASAVIVPHVNTAEQAARAVSSALYGPRGRRGAATQVFASRRGFPDWPAYHAHSLENTLVFPLIEEPEAVSNIEEIAAVPGLGGIFFGPFDLAVAMGLPASLAEYDVSKERARVYAAAKARNLPIADLAWGVTSALEKVKMGAQIIALGAEMTLFARALKGLNDEMKSTLARVSDR